MVELPADGNQRGGLLRRRCAVEQLGLAEAAADLATDRAGDHPALRVDQQHHRRSDALAVLRQRRSQGAAVGRGGGFPEGGVGCQQPHALDQSLRVELQHALEGFRAEYDLGVRLLAHGRRAHEMDQRQSGDLHGDEQHEKRGQDARRDLAEGQVVELGQVHGSGCDQQRAVSGGRPAAAQGQWEECRWAWRGRCASARSVARTRLRPNTI